MSEREKSIRVHNHPASMQCLTDCPSGHPSTWEVGDEHLWPADSPPCHECGADLDTDQHHAWCVAPLDQIEGDA